METNHYAMYTIYRSLETVIVVLNVAVLSIYPQNLIEYLTVLLLHHSHVSFFSANKSRIEVSCYVLQTVQTTTRVNRCAIFFEVIESFRTLTNTPDFKFQA